MSPTFETVAIAGTFRKDLPTGIASAMRHNTTLTRLVLSDSGSQVGMPTRFLALCFERKCAPSVALVKIVGVWLRVDILRTPVGVSLREASVCELIAPFASCPNLATAQAGRRWERCWRKATHR